MRTKNMPVPQVRGLLCCAAPIMKDFGSKSIMRFDLPGYKPAALQDTLAKVWGISDAESAIAVLGRYCDANAGSPAVAEVFDRIIDKNQYEIVRGIFALIKQEHLADLDLPRYFVRFWESVTNQANADLDAFMAFLSNPASPEQSATLHNITLSAVLGRLNKHIKGYETTMRSLSVFGYSTDELSAVKCFDAWDLALCGHIARMAAVCGYISEAVAWKFMEEAGVAVYKAYADWRQFLAAFFLGRGMALSADDIVGYSEIATYLLRDKKSPFRAFPLKNA